VGQVVSFEGYTPTARYDGIPFARVQVQESVASAGPFTVIDEVPLTPLDSDPSNPSARNVTTANASAASGLWYKLVFLDANDDQSESLPIRHEPDSVLAPTALCTDEDVRLYLAIKPTDLSDDDRGVIIRLVNAASETFADESQRLWVVPDDENPADRFYDVAQTDIDRGWVRIEDARDVVGIGYADGGSAPITPTDYADFYTLAAAYGDEPVLTKVFLTDAAPFGVGARLLITADWGWAASYQGVPEKVRQAVTYTAAEWYARDVQKFSGTFSIEEGRILLPQVLPSQVQSLAESYRRWRVA